MRDGSSSVQEQVQQLLFDAGVQQEQAESLAQVLSDQGYLRTEWLGDTLTYEGDRQEAVTGRLVGIEATGTGITRDGVTYYGMRFVIQPDNGGKKIKSGTFPDFARPGDPS